MKGGHEGSTGCSQWFWCTQFTSPSSRGWELDHQECWAPKNCCFWTLVLEKTLESPLDCKEIKPVSPKGNQSWIFIGRTDAEAPVLWPPDAKSWLIRKDTDAGKDWMQEKGTTEDGMVGWHHWLNGHEFEQTLGNNEGQGSLVCCSPWSRKELDMSEWLNWTESVAWSAGRVLIVSWMTSEGAFSLKCR